MAGQEILMSDETRELLGEDLVAFVNEVKDKPNVIISEADVEHDSPFGLVVDLARNNHILKEAGIENSQIRFDAIRSVMSLNFNNQAYHFSLAKFYEDKGIQYDALHDVHLVTSYSESSFTDFIAGSVPSMEGHFSDYVKGINPQDFASYVLFHEIGHYHGSDEYLADQFANELYKKAYAAGVVTDPNVPEVFAQFRAIDALIGNPTSKYHASGAIDPNTSSQLSSSFAEDLDNAKKEIYAAIGKDLVDLKMKVQALTKLAEEIMSPSQLAQYNEMYTSINDISNAELQEFMEGITIPEEFKEEYQAEIVSISADEASGLVKAQPELMHQEILKQMVTGAYDDQPDIKQLMHNYLMGAERIAPEHFGIEEGATPYADYLTSQGQTVTHGLNPGLRYNGEIPTHDSTPVIQ